MNYTEFYAKPASVDAAASNINGGDGTNLVSLFPCYNNSSSGVNRICIGGSTAGLSVGQFLTWDTVGSKRRGKISVIHAASAWDGFGGGTPCQLDVVPTDGGGDMTAGMSQAKYLVVGGNWLDPSVAAGLTVASVNASGNPPRLNVLAFDGGGNAITYATDVSTTSANNGTGSIPITVEAYQAAPGDLRGTNARALLRLNAGIAASGLLNIGGTYNVFRNLDCETTQLYKNAIFFNSANVIIERCRGKATQAAAIDTNYKTQCTVADCLFEESGRSTGDSAPWPSRHCVCWTAYYSTYSGNVVRNGTGDKGGVYFYSTYNDCFGNKIVKNPGDGITLDGTPQAISTLDSNDVSDNGGDGIRFVAGFTDASQVNLLDNNIAFNGGQAVNTSDTTQLYMGQVARNNFFGNSGGTFGVHMYDNGTGDDATVSPYSGADVATRAANDWDLADAVKRTKRTHADAKFSYYAPGSVQANSSSGAAGMVVAG